MVANLDTTPTAKTYDLEELVNVAWEGKIRVPHFQRDYRWNFEDVSKLLDSIVRGYPIGSLLLWSRKAQSGTIRLGALVIEAPETETALWVVDGQQRLTTLANVLHPDGQHDRRFALSYDLRSADFVRSGKSENPYIVPLSTIFNLQDLLQWFADNPDLREHLNSASELAKKIRHYSIPAYLVTEDRPEILQDIFDRMNNYGKRLSRAEIFAALNAGDELSPSSLTFDKIADNISQTRRFGKIDDDTILSAILARRGKEVRRDIRSEFEEKDDEGMEVAYQKGSEALELAVTFLQDQANVPHISFLAYRYLLVVLTRFFSFYPELEARETQLLRRWYWRAAMLGPENFKGGTANAARVLCGAINKPISDYKDGLLKSLTGLLHTLKSKEASEPVDLDRFQTNEARTKMLLCAYWHARPKNPLTAEGFERSDLADALEDDATAREAVNFFLPQKENRSRSAANRALLPNIQVDYSELFENFRSQPSTMSEQEWRTVLESHFVTEEMTSSLTNQAYDQVLTQRQGLMTEKATTFFDQMCEWDFEDTPPLASLNLDDE